MVDQRQITISNFIQKANLELLGRGIPATEVTELIATIAGCICLAAGIRSPQITPQLHASMQGMFNIRRNQVRSLSYADILQELRRQLKCENLSNDLAYADDVFLAILELIKHVLSDSISTEFFFEAVHQALRDELYGADAVKSRHIAQLAAELVSSPQSVWDYSLFTGDLPVLLTKNGHDLSLVHSSGYPQDDLLVRLRLAVHGIEVGNDDERKRKTDLLLLNLPDSGSDMDGHSAALILDNIFVKQPNFEFALVAVQDDDRTSGELVQTLRQHLVQQRFLVAVVDLGPLQAGSAATTANSVWLVSGEPVLALTDVLFINAASLLERDRDDGGRHAMTYVNELIRLWRAKTPVSSQLTLQAELGHLRGNFSRHFSQGYRNVENICRSVRRKDIERAHWSLARTRYEGKKHEQKESDFPAMDSLDLETLLVTGIRRAEPCQVYVIGNNGAGKSALLWQLAKTMSHNKINTIGISFGLHDRFPFAAKNKEAPRFRYHGARTTPTSVSEAKTTQRIARTMKLVQSNQTRLDTFQGILASIGFQCELFIMPVRKWNADKGYSPEQLRSIEQLTASAEKNIALYRDFAIAATTVGFKRANTAHKILTFSELSSGEQQMLSLAIKLCATAAEKVLFLIDEPEISLHVAWQRALPRMLGMVCTAFKCAAAVATHAPVLISSALEARQDCFVAENWVLTKIEHTKQQSVDAVLFDNFETYTPYTRRVAEHCAFLVADTIKQVNNPADEHLDIAAVLKSLDDAGAVVREASAALPANLAKGDLDLLRHAREAIHELTTKTA